MRDPNQGFRQTLTRLFRILGLCRRALLPLLLAGMTAPGLAQESPRVPVDQATTQQKAVFLNRLVSQSVSVKKIEESGDSEALAKLETARDLVREAEAALQARDFRTANDKLDAALELINQETRRLSEPEVTQASLRRAYDRRLHAVRTFLAAYERVAGEKQAGRATAAQVSEIKRLIDEAEALASEGDLERGIGKLDNAYRSARGDIRELRDGQTLTRSLDFESPEAEYDYERNRNDSHVMLLKFALSEKQPSAIRLEAVEALRGEAAAQRAAGERQAETGDFPGAIDSLVRSTDTLLKAIRMSGVYIPG